MNTTADVFLESLRKNSACPHVVVAWGEEEYFRKAVGRAFRQRAFAPGEEPTEWSFQKDFQMELWEKPSTPCLFSAGATGWSSKIPGCLRKRHRPENGHQREGKEGNASGTVHGTAQ
mgnify:CR=1 FL=1